MQHENLLIEIGTEELPSKQLTTLASAFSSLLESGLKDAELAFESITWHASPRRLALSVASLAACQQDKVVEKRGPAIAAAFDADGNPTKAAQGWARGNGIAVEDAERLVTEKGEWLLHKAQVTGKPLAEILPALVNQALAKLPIAKPMRWGSNRTQFIRPVHNVALIYGSTLIEGEVLGIQSSTTLSGHRFHGDGKFDLDHADNYLAALKKQYVMADFDARKDKIATDIAKVAAEHGSVADVDAELLDEVTGLVEWPVVLQAGFEESFLAVPKEALIYTMKDDQKYFPLLDSNGNLTNKFLFVSNIDSSDPSKVISGNEKVIRPRLADAEFFFNTDKKQTLESRLSNLESVLFQKQLGTLKEKSQRISDLASAIAGLLGEDTTLAARAGLLSKTDLLTNMVMEFPAVQGVMGMHYAKADGEHETVATALNEQYMPRFAGDKLPSSKISCAVALADKLDTLVGIFGIGQIPKGDKDPFALRRAAIGVLRIIIENELPLDLEALVTHAITLFADKLSNDNTQKQVVDFVLDRFRAFYQEQGIEIDVIQAVAATRPTRPADFAARIKGVAAFKQLSAASALAAANKRVANILAKNAESAHGELNQALLSEPAEQALASSLSSVTANVKPHLEQGNYVEVLSELSSLQSDVDAFFDNVMVMADDPAVKQNRLALLMSLRTLFLTSADISLLN